jgi:hypothetical protein
MGRKRYGLIWIKINGDHAVRGGSVTPAWVNIILGLAAVFVGSAILITPHVPGWSAAQNLFGIVWLVPGALCLTLRASFVLEPESRIWREQLTLVGFGRRREGSFDDAVGIQLVMCEDVRQGNFLAVVWRWRDEQRPALMLDSFRIKHEHRAKERWIALGRELGMPLVEWRSSGMTIVQAETPEFRRQASP